MKNTIKEAEIISLKEYSQENTEEFTLEKARELLDDKTISDERLSKIIEDIKTFCRIAYELYAMEQEKEQNNKIDADNQPLKQAA